MKKFFKKMLQTNPYQFSYKDVIYGLIIIMYITFSVLYNFKHIGSIFIINNLQTLLLIIILPLYGGQEVLQVVQDIKSKIINNNE